MGTIPGPIITFRWQTGDASSAIGQVASQVKKQLGDAGVSSAKATVSAYQAAAAQLRASLATEKSGTESIVAARKNIISLAEKEVAIHRQKDALTKSQLSTLRSATMEIERQRNALQGRGALTSATQQFIDAFKVRVGGMGGPIAARAYEPVGRFVTEGVGSFESAVGPAAIAIGGVAAAITAVGVAAALTTKHMMGLAQSIQNTAAATGLSSKQVQVYGELAKEMDIDQGSIEMAFARIQSQLGEYVTTGKAGGTGSQFFVKVMNQLGVSMTTKNGGLRDVSDIISDFSDKLQKIPDQATRTALTMEALGTRGRVLAQVMQEAASEGKSLGQVLREIGESGIVIPDAQLNNLMQAKARWDELTRSMEAAKIQTEGFIAVATTHPLGTIQSLIFGGLPKGRNSTGTIPTIGEFIQNPSGAGPAQSLGTGGTLSPAVLSATSTNESLAQRLQVLKAGGEMQLQLMQAEAGYAGAVKSHNQALVSLYASQISMLKQIIELESKRGQMTPFNKLVQRTGFAGRPLPRFPGGAYYSKSLTAPQVPGFGNPNLPEANLAGLLGLPSPDVMQNLGQAWTKLQQEFYNSTTDAVTKITDQYGRELQFFQDMNAKKLLSDHDLSTARIEIQKIESAKIEDLYKSEASGLFDALISGQKNFGQMLVRIIEGVVLEPIKESFTKYISKMLAELAKLTHPAASGKGGKGIGGVLGKILGALGIGEPATPANIGTQYVTAGSVIITSAGGIGGVAGGGIGNNLFGGGMSFGGGMGSVGSILGSVLPGAILLGQGLHDSNPVAIAMGIGMTGGPALTSISKMLSQSHPELSGVLGKIGGALPGIGMIAAGTQMGGVGGSAARHAANWQKAVTRAMRGEQLILPPSETFAFSAMGSMAQTLGTTFSEGPGGTFGNVALPANTPFWANAILGYPKTGGQLTALQMALAGVNTGLPFFGGNQTPFTGLPLPPGTHSFSSNATQIIHIQVDGKTMATALVKHMPNSVARMNTGMRQAAFSSTEMP